MNICSNNSEMVVHCASVKCAEAAFSCADTANKNADYISVIMDACIMASIIFTVLSLRLIGMIFAVLLVVQCSLYTKPGFGT